MLSTLSGDEVVTIFGLLCDAGIGPGGALALICASKELKTVLKDAPETLPWREGQRAGEALLASLAGMKCRQLRKARTVTFPGNYPIGMPIRDKHPMLILGTLSPLLHKLEDCRVSRFSLEQGVGQLAEKLSAVVAAGFAPFPQLRSLCLRGMGDPCATELARAMAKGALPRLVVLGGYCHIEPRPTYPPIDRLFLTSPCALCQIWPTTASAMWDWGPSHRPCCAWPR